MSSVPTNNWEESKFCVGERLEKSIEPLKREIEERCVFESVTKCEKILPALIISKEKDLGFKVNDFVRLKISGMNFLYRLIFFVPKKSKFAGKEGFYVQQSKWSSQFLVRLNKLNIQNLDEWIEKNICGTKRQMRAPNFPEIDPRDFDDLSGIDPRVFDKLFAEDGGSKAVQEELKHLSPSQRTDFRYKICDFLNIEAKGDLGSRCAFDLSESFFQVALDAKHLGNQRREEIPIIDILTLKGEVPSKQRSSHTCLCTPNEITNLKLFPRDIYTLIKFRIYEWGKYLTLQIFFLSRNFHPSSIDRNSKSGKVDKMLFYESVVSKLSQATKKGEISLSPDEIFHFLYFGGEYLGGTNGVCLAEKVKKEDGKE